jgi:hypothetical protein
MSHAGKADKLLIKPAAGARPAPPCRSDGSFPRHARRPVTRRVTNGTETPGWRRPQTDRPAESHSHPSRRGTARASAARMSAVARNRTARSAALGLVIVAGMALLVFRWWSGPAPEREAQHYFDQAAPGVVEVIECEYAAGGDSVFDRFWCDLTSEEVVPRPPDGAGVAIIARGRGGYCFIIPRAAKRPWRSDMDAFPIYRARSVRDCQGG